MKVLCLYNNECALELFEWIKEQGNEIVLCSEKLDVKWCVKSQFDLTVSYTYRYILDIVILNALNNNVVNIHNSYLPWNRGADPNMWSILEGTPRGVTLHYMDTTIDKGYIIAQRLVLDDEENRTMESTYYNLDNAAKLLFKEAFQYYEYWPEMKKKAIGRGTYHSVEDGRRIKDKILTYSISIEELKKIE